MQIQGGTCGNQPPPTVGAWQRSIHTTAPSDTGLTVDMRTNSCLLCCSCCHCCCCCCNHQPAKHTLQFCLPVLCRAPPAAGRSPCRSPAAGCTPMPATAALHSRTSKSLAPLQHRHKQECACLCVSVCAHALHCAICSRKCRRSVRRAGMLHTCSCAAIGQAADSIHEISARRVSPICVRAGLVAVYATCLRHHL